LSPIDGSCDDLGGGGSSPPIDSDAGVVLRNAVLVVGKDAVCQLPIRGTERPLVDMNLIGYRRGSSEGISREEQSVPLTTGNGQRLSQSQV